MTRSTLAIFIGLVLLLGLVIGAVMWLRRSDHSPSLETGQARREITSPENTYPVELFFAGRGHLLYGETRELAGVESATARLEQIVEAVLSGPASSDLFATVPAGIRILAVHLNDEGVAFVNLAMESPNAQPSWGSKRELLAAYSLVNSILLNLPDASKVVLLWNGTQRPTFAGHLDTRRGLVVDESLMADPPR